MSLATKLAAWKRTRFVVSIVFLTVALIFVVIGAPQMEEAPRMAVYVGAAVIIVAAGYELVSSAYDELRGGGSMLIVATGMLAAPPPPSDAAKSVSEAVAAVPLPAKPGGTHAEDAAADAELRDGELAQAVTEALLGGAPLAATVPQAAARLADAAASSADARDCAAQYAERLATLRALLVLTQTGIDIAHAAVERAAPAVAAAASGADGPLLRLLARGSPDRPDAVALDDMERDADRLRTLYVALSAIATSPGCDVDVHALRATLETEGSTLARADPVLAAGRGDLPAPDDDAMQHALRFAKGLPDNAIQRAVDAQAARLTADVLRRLERAAEPATGTGEPAAERGASTGEPAAERGASTGSEPAAERGASTGSVRRLVKAHGHAGAAARALASEPPGREAREVHEHFAPLVRPAEASRSLALLARHFGEDEARAAAPRCLQALAFLHALGPDYRPVREETCCEAAVFVAALCARDGATEGLSEGELQRLAAAVAEGLPRPACHVDVEMRLRELQWHPPVPPALLAAAVRRYCGARPVGPEAAEELLWAAGVGDLLARKAADYAADSERFERDVKDGAAGLRVERAPAAARGGAGPLGAVAAPDAPAALYACKPGEGPHRAVACRALSELWFRSQVERGWRVLRAADELATAARALVDRLLGSSAAAQRAAPALRAGVATTFEQAASALLAAAARLQAAYAAPAGGRSAEELRTERADFACAFLLAHGVRQFALRLWGFLYGEAACGDGDVPYMQDAANLQETFEATVDCIVPRHATPTVEPGPAAVYLQGQPGDAARFAFGEPASLADLQALVPGVPEAEPGALEALLACVDEGLGAQLAPFRAATVRLAGLADAEGGAADAVEALREALALPSVEALLGAGGGPELEPRLLRTLLARSGFEAAALRAATRLCPQSPERAVEARMRASHAAVEAFLEAATIAAGTALRDGRRAGAARDPSLAARLVETLTPFVAPLAAWADAQAEERLRDRAAAMRTAHRRATLHAVRLAATERQSLMGGA